jgi:hypothetical protein
MIHIYDYYEPVTSDVTWHLVNNALEEDKIEIEKNNDSKISVNHFEVEDIDSHATKWQSCI